MATPENDRDRLIGALERVLACLEKRTHDVSGTVYVSAQQPLGDIVQPLWHIRRDNFVQLRVLALMFDAAGPLHRIATTNGWEAEFEEARRDFDIAFAALNRPRYHASSTPVELGDHVRLRAFFRKRAGRVVYLPGVSPPKSEIDYGGICRIGVALEDGGHCLVHIEPDSLAVKKGVVLERRDPDGVPEPPSDAELRE